ncbi:MAG: LysR family transcriptional regulator [Myxococcota bacterium]|jgi:LysR family glycine cleavage system transcriptional activator|nr:LysR family transcriptional regulator [Myxococcota bacterium]
MLELAWLRAFHEGVRCGSYRQAAARLHVTPSAVSHAVSKLQDAVGTRLIEWQGRSLRLSAEGELLAASCRRIFGELERAEEELANAAGTARRLRLGAPIEFGTTVLVDALAPRLHATPAVRIDFHFAHELATPLLEGALELIVDCRDHRHPALERTPLFRERYVVVASPALLARHPLPTPAALADAPLLALDPDASWWSKLLLALPEAERPALARPRVIDHVRGLVHGATAGLGLALLPKYAVQPELRAGLLLPVFPELPLQDDTFCIYRRLDQRGREPAETVRAWLLALRVDQFGDAITPAAR